MNDGAQVAKKCRFLVLLKGEEQYFFKYDSGDELGLCYTLIDFALDPEVFDLTVKEKFYGETAGIVAAMVSIVFLQWWRSRRS